MNHNLEIQDMGRGCAASGRILFERAKTDYRDEGKMTVGSLKYNLGKKNVELELTCNLKRFR